MAQQITTNVGIRIFTACSLFLCFSNLPLIYPVISRAVKKVSKESVCFLVAQKSVLFNDRFTKMAVVKVYLTVKLTSQALYYSVRQPFLAANTKFK